jgi:hypothetical protein
MMYFIQRFMPVTVGEEKMSVSFLLPIIHHTVKIWTLIQYVINSHINKFSLLKLTSEALVPYI